MAPESGAKRLALLKEAVPRMTRPAVLANPTAPLHAPEWKEIEVAALRVRGIRAARPPPSLG